jgi:D-glycero-D-manno-heptose 1,7-bisphosphate phosphatase
MHHLPTTAFLDRDGVINRKMPEGSYVETWEQFEFLPGAVEALRMLRATGIRTVVVTNQRGVALGRLSAAELAHIHAQMQLTLADAAVDAIFVCPHDVDSCACRKPGLGLFEQAMAAIPAIDLAESVVVGDSVSDLQAGNELGCRSYLVGSESLLEAITTRNPGLKIEGRSDSLLGIVTTYLASGAGAAVDG